jgi:pimeloyl-ACP methyl ester carboxylesterase
MTKPILHFAHANSFPAGTYRVMFEALRHHYDLRYLDVHAHNPQYPVKTGWRELVDELLADVMAKSSEPVILVGHSLGGMLCLMAAKVRPDLVRAVVLLDAPVVAGWRAVLVGMARNTKLGDTFSPASGSVKRRYLWPNAQAAYDHFISKDIFARWAPGVLQDYIDSGFVPHAEGVTLRFTRETETAVYRALPDHIGKLVRDGFPVPIGFIGGVDSEECRRASLGPTRKLVGKNFRQVAGGHLYPMEAPGIAAATIHELIQSMTTCMQRT